MKNKIYLLSCVVVIFLSCNTEKENNPDSYRDNKEQSETLQLIEPKIDKEIKNYIVNEISLTEIKAQQYPDASLSLKNQPFKEGLNALHFTIENNQNFGITTIQNNYTIQTHSSAIFEQEFLTGNNVFLAFLTDKNKLAIKTNKATFLENIVLFDEPIFNTKAPHLFYYLPQNNQAILDFCLLNTSLSENGNQLEVIINETVFYIKKWAAYQIEGLTKKENTIRLRLLDKDKKLIPGPFNDSGERMFTIKNQNS
ncbi:MAG: hypothetical protein COW67_11470 [Flavobacteriales bacterium CG18_big_fil_WC_8_21_14_2_50_32_9]|nr:MAG: hypothetical protein COW67_11470 [Flavobacteriales bacterium CG18_big_fil_WC_8_21_14_2_50_32_9]